MPQISKTWQVTEILLTFFIALRHGEKIDKKIHMDPPIRHTTKQNKEMVYSEMPRHDPFNSSLRIVLESWTNLIFD